MISLIGRIQKITHMNFLQNRNKFMVIKVEREGGIN